MHEEFRERNEDGLVEANEAAHYIAANVATSEEMMSLVDVGIYNVADIIEGRYNGEQEPTVQQFMRDINESFGWKFFLLV